MNPEQKAPLPTIYFLRELTGVVIAGWTIYFLTYAIFDPTLAFIATQTFRIASAAALLAAVFHTITWFLVTVQLAPMPLKKSAQIAFFFGLIVVWLGVSYFLLGAVYI